MNGFYSEPLEAIAISLEGLPDGGILYLKN